jgi:hypothetical protein
MKVLAAQMIVAHHFVIYSPMADVLSTQWPGWVAWLDDHGRLAVQPFLVMGGYLAAVSIGRRQPGPFWVGVGRRYWRLMPPLAISLGLVVLVTWSVGHHLEGADWVSPLPSLGSFLAHLFMLQDVLGLASISAGVWYIAIDLQLFALFLLLHKIGAIYVHRLSVDVLSFMVAALTLVSIHGLSRQPWLDMWAIYFFSAYGLGVLVAWSKAHQAARGWLALTVALLLLDVLWDPRVRPVCALFAAGLLWLWGQSRVDSTRAWVRFLHRAGDGSYAVFVSHFAVIILSSAVWELLQPQDTGVAGLFLLGAWLLTLAVGHGVDRGAQGLNAWFQPKPLDKHPHPAASVPPRSRR